MSYNASLIHTGMFVPGNESIAIVEFAPFQKIPVEKKKPDSKIGTIEIGTCIRRRVRPSCSPCSKRRTSNRSSNHSRKEHLSQLK